MTPTEKDWRLLDEEGQKLRVFSLEKAGAAVPDAIDMPSDMVYRKKNWKRALGGLQYVDEECNTSWYRQIAARWAEHGDEEAIFYRGTSISGKQMLDRADAVTRSLLHLGVEAGEEIACCMANVPELLYLMLGANRIGVKLNFLGTGKDPLFLEDILTSCSSKVFFATDSEYEVIQGTVDRAGFASKVLISLADSLPERPDLCTGYEPELDDYYHYQNMAEEFVEEDDTAMRFSDFLDLGKNYEGLIVDDGNLDTEFLVTYTSGSTKTGFPKRMYHTNRSLIVSGVFHDPQWSGNPAAPGFRALAHIHTESNTNLITTISDALFQNWSVAMEPEYNRDIFLDILYMDKPNLVPATTSFYLRAAQQYSVEKRYHDENGKGRRMPWLFCPMAVGEGCTPGEEAFINAFLKECHAGSGVKLGGIFHKSHVTLGIGGGDPEHGGIYYTLWRASKQRTAGWKLHGDTYGMNPVPYARVTCLRRTSEGTYVECGFHEYGIVVANSASSLSRYANFDQLKRKVITDFAGNDWLSCDVFGYIDDLGCVHVKDRADSTITLEDGSRVLPYEIVDEAVADSDNILSAVVTPCETGGRIELVLNLEFRPMHKETELGILQELDQRLRMAFPDIADRFLYRKFDLDHPFPVTGSGKRDINSVQNLGARFTYRFLRNRMYPVIG